MGYSIIYHAAERFFYTSISVIGTVLMFFIVVYLGFQVGPTVERMINPVVKNFELTMVEPYLGGTVFQFNFEKRRDCEFKGFEIFHSNVLFTTGKTPRKLSDKEVTSNPVGKYGSSIWYVEGIFPKDLKDNSRIYWQHRCHPLWLTRTMVYP